MQLKNKTVVLGVCGGIAAYKAADFVAPLSFQSLSKNPVVVNMFDEPKVWEIQHISLAKAADVFAIVPATANVIGKIANGIADDMLTTTVMATRSPVLIAPAMNTNMLENPIVEENIEKLKRHEGYYFVTSETGRLACGDVGRGKLAKIEAIFDEIERLAVLGERDLEGKKIVISAGATEEALDPVRFLTNHSTGKMGFSLAKAAMLRGAEVTLVAGRNTCAPITGVNTINVTSALQMHKAVTETAKEADIVIMSAAVADFRPSTVAENKIKKGADNEMSISFVRNPDILKELGSAYGGSKVIIGFAMETENLLENAKNKCVKKGADLMLPTTLNQRGRALAPTPTL